uniref:Uncharacterized protein n=1 Tax=Meloidogyne hapla TaxID=6305 RepID=A0A1I8BNY9_MELHA
MPKIWDLLRKSKYYLINVHPLEQSILPKNPNRIVDIGGIEVEMERILNGGEDRNDSEKNSIFDNELLSNFLYGNFLRINLNKVEYVHNWIKKQECVVIFSMDKDVGGFTKNYLNDLINTFENYKDCKFLVLVDQFLEFKTINNKIVNKNVPNHLSRGGLIIPKGITYGNNFVYKNRMLFYYNKMIKNQELLGKN